MPFRHNVLGALVAADPSAAHKKLVALFKKHGSSDAVSASLLVNTTTLARWIKRLREAGLPDPRSTTRARTRRNASPAERTLAVELKQAGKPVSEIAAALGYNAKTVARWFRQAS